MNYQDKMHADRQADQERQYSSDIVYPNQVKIQKDIPNILRIVGSGDYQKCFASWIICDDGTKRRFIIENELEGRGVLSRIIGDKLNWYKGGILETKKDSVTNKKVDVWYSPQDPELMDIVKSNGDSSGKSGSWKPKTEYIFNVIDRSMEAKEDGTQYNWCKENKKTKILILGPTAFDTLVDTNDNNGPLDEYDINYLKKGSDLNTKHTIMKAGDRIPGVVVGPLSSEEQEYETYDLKLAAKLASATYVLKYLKNTIARVEAVMGVSFITELEAQAAMEKQEWDSKKESSGGGDTPLNPPISQTSTVVSAPTARVRVAQPTPSGNMVECGYCHKPIPENSEVCPECSQVLLAPCDSCHKPFSVFAKTCPFCSQVYQ